MAANHIRKCERCGRVDCRGAKYNAGRAALLCQFANGSPGERLAKQRKRAVAEAFDQLSHIEVPRPESDSTFDNFVQRVPLSSVPESYAADVIRRALEAAFDAGRTCGAHTATENERCEKCDRAIESAGTCRQCQELAAYVTRHAELYNSVDQLKSQVEELKEVVERSKLDI